MAKKKKFDGTFMLCAMVLQERLRIKGKIYRDLQRIGHPLRNN